MNPLTGCYSSVLNFDSKDVSGGEITNFQKLAPAIEEIVNKEANKKVNKEKFIKGATLKENQKFSKPNKYIKVSF